MSILSSRSERLKSHDCLHSVLMQPGWLFIQSGLVAVLEDGRGGWCSLLRMISHSSTHLAEFLKEETIHVS